MYSLVVENRCVESCTWPVTQLYICKHMFLVCRVRSLAFSERRSISSVVSGDEREVESSFRCTNVDESVGSSLEGMDTAYLIPDIKEDNSLSLLLKIFSDFNVNNSPDDLAGLKEKLATIKNVLLTLKIH